LKPGSRNELTEAVALTVHGGGGGGGTTKPKKVTHLTPWTGFIY